MNRKTILITGCQRSGTTLMHLILNSHPDVTSINESKFKYHHINTYLSAPRDTSHVCFKLPRYAPIYSFIKSIPDLRLLWCVRDPFDVVLSMIKLKIRYRGETAISWAAHPEAASAEILNCYWALDAEEKRGIEQCMNEYRDIASKNPFERGHRDLVFLASLCWRIKNDVALHYERVGIKYQAVNYEALVSDKVNSIIKILDYLGLEWHDDVLRHHERHEGISSGNTDTSRPISAAGVGGGKISLAREDLALIREVCGEIPLKWGYVLAS